MKIDYFGAKQIFKNAQDNPDDEEVPRFVETISDNIFVGFMRESLF